MKVCRGRSLGLHMIGEILISHTLRDCRIEPVSVPRDKVGLHVFRVAVKVFSLSAKTLSASHF